MLFPAAAALQRSDSVYTRGFFPRCFQIYSFGDTTSHGPPQCSGVSKLAENLENSHAGHYVDLHREIRSIHGLQLLLLDIANRVGVFLQQSLAHLIGYFIERAHGIA